jgi:hypothetical protein
MIINLENISTLESMPADVPMGTIGEDERRCEPLPTKVACGGWCDEQLFENTRHNLQHILWPSLRGAIQSFVYNVLPAQVSWDTVDAARAAKAKSISPVAEKFVTSTNALAAREFYSSWIWRILCENLFSQKCEDKWKSGPWQHFAKTQQLLQCKEKAMLKLTRKAPLTE